MKPYYQDKSVTIYHGDCRKVLASLPRLSVCITDPPTGETKFSWDKPIPISDWLSRLPAPTLWLFGSLKFFLANVPRIKDWRHIQDVVWEKHNGSSLHADRFRRVHILIAQFIGPSVRWRDVYKSPVYTNDARPRIVRRKYKPPHLGEINGSTYVSIDGGPRLMRSVMRARSCHGKADNPTQKPIEILKALIEYSCPPDGIVLDLFMGSGSTLRAAKDLGRKAIGIDIRKSQCEKAVRLCSQGMLPLSR